MHEPESAVGVEALVIWSTVAEPVAQSDQIAFTDVVLAIRVKGSADAAHELGTF